MLSWACKVPVGQGGRWLERNPLAGVRREREKNPRRAVATWERFTATRAAIHWFAQRAKAELEEVSRLADSTTDTAERDALLRARGRHQREHARWRRIELALVLAEATGRRLGSIRALGWEDIDLAKQRITWRAEADKKGVEWVVPLPPGLADELREFRRAFGAVAGPLFPSEQDPTKLMDRHLFDK